MRLAIGETLQNRYRIVSRLAQGGMGAVYRAWHLNLNIPVAVKEMVPQPGLDPNTLAQLRQQFQQEATVLARLNHPHLVRVIDSFEEGGYAYLVMDFVAGESLGDCIARQGPLPEADVLAWAEQLLDALSYCHSQGVIHRDVKPQNVIIRPDGRAVLVDFGLMKLWNPSAPETKPAMQGMGTPEYAPPEQYGAQTGYTDHLSDVYSLGATLYHALTGEAPATATDCMADPEQFVLVRTLNPHVSLETAEVVTRAMALTRTQRWQSAAEMAQALSGGSPALARPPAPKRQPQPQQTKAMPGARPATPVQQRRIPAWAWALVVVALVTILALGTMLTLGHWPATPGQTTATPTNALTKIPPTEPPSTPTMAPTATPLSSAPPVSIGQVVTQTRPADEMVMVYVPAGEFEMGSTAGNSDEQPVHTVALDAFWIDRIEVTNAQYQRCVTAGACDPPVESGSSTRDSYYGDSDYDDYPVIQVSWHQARTYCAWAGGRLPTEAEWEYAARGPEGWVFPWGNEFDGTRLNYCDVNCTLDWADETVDDGYADTTPVGNYPGGASWCGALDMAGNVWEWVADLYGDYPSGRQVNPTGPSSGEYRGLRGGSLNNDTNSVRCSNRRRNAPTYRFSIVGFRCSNDSG